MKKAWLQRAIEFHMVACKNRVKSFKEILERINLKESFNMHLLGERILIIGAKLTNYAEYLVLFFLIYSTYFTEYKDFTNYQDLMMLVVIGVMYLIVGAIPFGMILTPILFEWLFLDIPFWDFSMFAWAVTFTITATNVMVWVGALLQIKEHPQR